MEKPSYKQKLHLIQAVFLDIDGVITDGKVIMHPSGEFLRNMSTRDGYAIKKAANSDVLVFVISGGSSESMRKRLEFLDSSLRLRPYQSMETQMDYRFLRAERDRLD